MDRGHLRVTQTLPCALLYSVISALQLNAYVYVYVYENIWRSFLFIYISQNIENVLAVFVKLTSICGVAAHVWGNELEEFIIVPR